MDVDRHSHTSAEDAHDPLVPVCDLDELGPGGARLVQAGDREIAVFNVDGSFYAIENLCPHSGGPLVEGTLDGTRVICSWHYATFDLETGESLDSISRYDVDTFPVRVREGRIWVAVADRSPEVSP